MKAKYLLFICFISIAPDLFAQPTPVITSFSPNFGLAGTVVTISGANFHPNKDSNIVYFGEVRAIVTSGSVTSLSVIVPGSATYSPITVTTNNLTTSSTNFFILTFDNGTIDANSFDTTQVGMLDDPNSSLVLNSDLNNDGKLDLIVSNGYSGGLSVYRNLNSGNSFAFSQPQEIDTTLHGCSSIFFKVFDMDGDGLKDIVYRAGCYAEFLIFKNTSTIANLSFAPKVVIPIGPGDMFCIADIDTDGRPDFIDLNIGLAIASIYRNTSIPGTFSFAPKVDISAGGQPPEFTDPRTIIASDFNGDGKPDLAISRFHSGAVYIVTNNSTPGSISFVSGQNIYTGLAAYWLSSGDLDADGKIDLVVVSTDFGTRTISVLKNTRIANEIIFADPKNYLESYGGPVEISDMDGDKKPDIVVKNGDSLLIRKNSTSGGIIDFSEKIIYPLPGHSFCIGDLNGDNLPDISTCGLKLLIFKSFTKKPIINSITPPEGIPGTQVILKGHNFTGTSSVKFGKTRAISFTATSDSTINAEVDTGTTGKITVVSSTGTGISPDSFYMTLPPAMYSFSPDTATMGYPIDITGKDFTRTSSVTIGGMAVDTFTVVSDSAIVAIVGNGSSGRVVVKNPYGSDSLGGFVYQQPAASLKYISFTPGAGPVGSIVTITPVGGSFSPGLPYTVYFGIVKANIISVTPSSMIVKVPAGGNYMPVSVTTNRGLTYYSNLPFIITFDGTDLFPGSFDTATVYSGVGNGRAIAAGDFDGDGKPDIAVANVNDTIVSLYRNAGTPGIILLMPIAVSIGVNVNDIAIVDIDGDTRIDIILSGSYGVHVLRNISTPGKILFAEKLSFPTGGAGKIACADFNGDGRPDISITSNKLSVLKNISTPGHIAFASQIEYATTDYCIYIAAKDLDGDGRPDLVLNISTAIVAVRNTSIGGSISFSATVDTIRSGFVQDYFFSLGDLNTDGKADIIVEAPYANSVLCYRNTSMLGNINFSVENEHAINGTGNISTVDLTDFNGDGKPDPVLPYYAGINVVQNSSGVGAISFSNNVIVPFKLPFESPYTAIGCDIDMDGKPDIVSSAFTHLEVFRNKNGEPTPLVLCPPAATANIISNINGASYQWQADAGNGYTNISNNANYTGTTSAALGLVNVPSSWYGNKYRCFVNGKYSSVTELKFENNWTGTMNTNWSNPANWSCGSVPDSYTDVVITSGTVIISSNVTVRTLKVSPGASVTVSSGYTLTVLH